MTSLLAVLAIVMTQVKPADPLLSLLAGEWQGEGTVLERPARVRLTWEWALDGRFMRLTFSNEMGSQRFEGHAYYQTLGDDRYRGWWFDNSGTMRPIDGTRDGDTLVARWGTPETEIGETTYRRMPDGTLEIVDRVRSKTGQWRDFGKTRLVRITKERPLLEAAARRGRTPLPVARPESRPSR